MTLHPLRERLSPYAERLSVILFAAIPFILLPGAGDPLQAPRLTFVLVAVVLATAFAPGAAADRRTKIAMGVLGVLLLWVLASSLGGGIASGLFGVHGRLGGLVGLLALALTSAAGWLTLHRHRRVLVMSLAVAGACQSVWVFYTFLRDGQAFGTGGNQVITGGWLAVAFGVVLAAFVADRADRTRTWLMGSACAIMLAALGVLGSRGSWVGALAATAFVLLADARHRVSRRAVIAVSIAVLLVGGAVLAGGESVTKLDPRRILESSGAARVSIWTGTGAMIADHPVMGVGTGRFLYEFPRYEPLERAQLEPDVRADQAHSLPLQLAAESGIPALLAAIALLALVTGAALDGMRRRDGVMYVLVSGSVAYAGQALFGVTAIEVDVLGWLLAGAVVGRAALLAARDAKLDAQGPSGAFGRRLGVASALVAIAGLGIMICYINADLAYGRGLRSFDAGQMEDAYVAHQRAVSICPVVDNYRVGVADVAVYGGAAERATALEHLDRGLALEPVSFDLAIARARLLQAEGSDAGIVADAYVTALEMNPWGVEVARETAVALVAADRIAEAVQVAENLLLVIPDDDIAHEITRSYVR